MQIAVAGVEYIGDAKPVPRRQGADLGQHFGQAAARDRAVHAVIVGDPPDRRKRRLAAGPEEEPLGFVAADPDGLRAVGAGERLDLLDQVVDLDLRPIELDDQQRLGIERVASVGKLLGGVDRRAVHHLHAARDDAGADDRGDAIAGVCGRGKADQQCPRRWRLFEDAHGDLGDYPEQALGAGHHPHQIVALGIEMLAAEADDLAVHQHHFEAEQIVGGEPVFEAVHAARIFRDIAPDRAGDLARRVGRVIKPGTLDRMGDREIGHPGLDDDAAVVVVDIEDAVELGHAEEDPVGQRQGATRQRGAGAARHDLHPLGLAIAQHRGDLRDGRG